LQHEVAMLLKLARGEKLQLKLKTCDLCNQHESP
jgi:hypothetical protein